MELLSKVDKQLIESQDKLKESKKQVKVLEVKLEDTIKAWKKVQHKDTMETQTIATSIKCRECEFVCSNQEDLREHKRIKKDE